MPQLFQLLLQPQVVLYLLLGIAMAQAHRAGELLQQTPSCCKPLLVADAQGKAACSDEELDAIMHVWRDTALWPAAHEAVTPN